MRKPISKKIFLWLALFILAIAYVVIAVVVIQPIVNRTYQYTYLLNLSANFAVPLAYFCLGGILSSLFRHFSEARLPKKIRKPVAIVSAIGGFVLVCGFFLYLAFSLPAPWNKFQHLLFLLNSEIPVLCAVPGFFLDLSTDR